MFYIYKITNLINGKTYIGQHKYKKLNDDYMGSGILISKAIKKYGKENFTKEILYSKIQYKETADSVEIFAIAKERKLGKAEYNIADGGQGGDIFDSLSNEERKKIGSKISKALKGEANGMYGKHHTDEAKRKISKVHKGNKIWVGKHHTDETKQKISEARKGKPTRKDKHHTDETKRKMSEMRRGRKLSEDWKQKIGEAHKVPFSDEMSKDLLLLNFTDFHKKYNISCGTYYRHKKSLVEGEK